jgi:hypothetical protein
MLWPRETGDKDSDESFHYIYFYTSDIFSFIYLQFELRALCLLGVLYHLSHAFSPTMDFLAKKLS